MALYVCHGSFFEQLDTKSQFSPLWINRILSKFKGYLCSAKMIILKLKIDRIWHSSFDNVKNTKHLIFQVDSHFGRDVLVVVRGLNLAVVDESGEGVAVRAKSRDLASELDLNISGGKLKSQFTVNLLLQTPEEIKDLLHVAVYFINVSEKMQCIQVNACDITSLKT